MESSSDRYWTAFYTKPRSEKKTADRLIEQGFEVYCPVIEEMKQWSDRKKKVKVPLFKSYLFARVNDSIRTQILQDQGIVAGVTWLGKPGVIRDVEIEAIKRLVGESNQVQLEEYQRFEKGDLVEVNFGALKGVQGALLDIKRNKVVVQIEGLQMQLTIDVSQVRHQL